MEHRIIKLNKPAFNKVNARVTILTHCQDIGLMASHKYKKCDVKYGFGN